MPIANIYLALMFFTEDPQAIKCRTLYVPATSSKEAEMLLRVEQFELMSRSDVFTYIQTDESIQRTAEVAGARIHWVDEGRQPIKPMTSHEFSAWRHGYVVGQADAGDAVYRRALP